MELEKKIKRHRPKETSMYVPFHMWVPTLTPKFYMFVYKEIIVELMKQIKGRWLWEDDSNL